MRAARESPWGSPEDLPFRFAVFINGATPIHAFPFSDVAKTARKVGVSTLTDEITAALLRRSNMKGVEQIMATDRPAYLEAGEMALETMQARDGRLFLTDRVNCVWRYDASYDGTSLTIPTLHIRDPKDDKDQGLELLKLCDMSRVKEYHHVHGHDFPRGYAEMAKIASLIRSTAELV
ncbi:MAG: hypothetical protein M1818_002181 [Claussenomyces sp. TS43310]|nr:MAG: hypothetical protein M1818_002181 [Claussenomyces sp. TS43310]